MQAIFKLLDLATKRNARQASKGIGAIAVGSLRSARLPLPKTSEIESSGVARALQRLAARLPSIGDMQLQFRDNTHIVILDEDTGDAGAGEEVKAWAQQMDHAQIAAALSGFCTLHTLSPHSTDMLPLISYLSLSQLRSLDISNSKVPHAQLQLIPKSLKHLTSLTADLAGCSPGTLLEAADIAALSKLSNLQRLQLDNSSDRLSTAGKSSMSS